jgi:hypothetical protein
MSITEMPDKRSLRDERSHAEWHSKWTRQFTLFDKVIGMLFPYKKYGKCSDYPGVTKGMSQICQYDLTYAAIDNWCRGRRHPTLKSYLRILEHVEQKRDGFIVLAEELRQGLSYYEQHVQGRRGNRS